MSLPKFIGSLGLVILTSFFFFPFSFTFLPAINTKMALAAVGLVWFIVNLAHGGGSKLDKSFFYLSLLAILVSITAFATTVINNTIDYTYASYIVSMWVWMGGAYCILNLIRLLHGEASVILVCNYIVAVCVMQCFIALAIDSFPSFKAMVNRFIDDMGFIEMDRLNGAGRLYGIGCCLDVAGTRFAAALIMLAFTTCKLSELNRTQWLWLYFIAFAVITLVGNMISRTTLIGVVVAILVWIIAPVMARHEPYGKLWKQFLIIAVIAISFSTILYQQNKVFQANLRFGFEGFFSLIETGHWETNSNNILKTMIVFPENIHTWVIGDGYMMDPSDLDPNYVGESYGGYYMSTDIGYLRFIFYFGLIGLSVFSIFMVAIALALVNRQGNFKWLFVLLLTLNFIIWFKVSTDIFPVFALLLCVKPNEGENDETGNEEATVSQA